MAFKSKRTSSRENRVQHDPLHQSHDQGGESMTSTITAARQTQRQALRQTFHICGTCDRTLSIAEFIERHCESCRSSTKPIATKEKAA
jgi:uncharacterized CHY-type Zn-finger protein